MEVLRLLNDLDSFLIMEGQSGKIDFEVACEIGRMIDKIKEQVVLTLPDCGEV